MFGGRGEGKRTGILRAGITALSGHRRKKKFVE
jgi:hypothetical protein